MIVIGVDVRKQSLTAVVVDEVGRPVAELTVGSSAGLVAWSGSLDPERLWAVEDCRQLTGALERRLLAAGESLVRVPPKLMAPERRASRARGKSDPIDALAVAGVALREPHLDRPRPGEAALRELKLLVDHRDDLVDERRRCQQRLRWQLHDLDPELTVPPGALERPLRLDRVARRRARAEQTVRVRIARELVGRCRSLTRTILALDRELQARIDLVAQHCSRCPAAAHSAPPSCSARSARSNASTQTRNSPATPASHRSKRAPESTDATGSTAAATANSTAHRTGSPSPKRASTRQRAPTSSASRARARAAEKRSAASNDNSHAPSTPRSRTSQH
jgi:transposase